MDIASRSSSHDLASYRVAALGWARRLPPSWTGMGTYLAGGLLLGLVLIVALTLTRGDSPRASASVVTDNIVYLGAHDIGETCWRGVDTREPARLTVSLEVGVDGTVGTAIAAGETPAMRTCVEAYVKAWKFLPQAASAVVTVPVEIATP